MSSWSARKAQTELAALVAVFAVCAGLVLYVGALDAALPGERASETPRRAADRAADLVREGGVVRPERLHRATGAAPTDHRLNATLVAADRRWTAGPPVPDRSPTATRRVSVRVGPGRVRPGRLRVAVWG
jgi:hypothetical protein